MASASVTQNVALTAMDNYLTTGSSESFFISSIQKYAVFSLCNETVETQDWAANRELSWEIPRHGDYLKHLTLVYDGPGLQNEAGAVIMVPGSVQGGEDDAAARHHESSDSEKAGVDAAGAIVKTCAVADPAVDRVSDLCARYCNFFTCQVIQKARFLCGSQEIDSLTGTHCQIFYSSFIGLVPKRSLNVGSRYERAQMALQDTCRWYITLPFYFCCEPHLTWNMLASNFSSMYLKVTFGNPTSYIENLNTNTNLTAFSRRDGTGGSNIDIVTKKYGSAAAPALSDYTVSLMCGFVYIGSDERNARLSETRDQLILQHQIHESLYTCTSASDATASGKELDANFPVALQTFIPRWSVREDMNQRGDFTGKVNAQRICAELPDGMPEHLLTDLEIKFNGNVKQEAQHSLYFTELQHQMHSVRVPEYNHIYLYSYALFSPYSGNASGTANYSRIDKIKASFKVNYPGSGTVVVDALQTSYNLINFTGGTVTLKFAS